MDARFKKLQEWERRYNNVSVNGNDEASDIAVDSAGNVYVTGYSIGRTTGPDYYTISYTSGGVQGLSARYDGPAHEGDYANAIVVDSSGNVYVTGYSYRGMPYKHSDYCTLKYDSTRKLVWNAQYDDRRNGNDVATAVAVDNSGFVYITGRSEDSLTKTDVKHYDYYTIKYNASTGRVEWGARYNGSVNGIDEATAIAVDAVGNVYVTGRSLGNGTGLDYITIKYAPTGGNPLWAARYNNINGNDEATAIAVDLLGNVYVTGKSQGNGTGLDYVTIKYDTIGIQKWVVRYNNALANGADEAAAIAVDSAGNVYVTGKSWGNTTGFDYFTIKYGSSGDMVWRVRYNHSGGNDEATAVVVDAAGNVYVTGRSQGNGTGLDYATVKYKQK